MNKIITVCVEISCSTRCHQHHASSLAPHPEDSFTLSQYICQCSYRHSINILFYVFSFISQQKKISCISSEHFSAWRHISNTYLPFTVVHAVQIIDQDYYIAHFQIQEPAACIYLLCFVICYLLEACACTVRQILLYSTYYSTQFQLSNFNL